MMTRDTGRSKEKKPAAPLQTHHAFLDTQVFRKLGHNSESPPLLALRQQIAAGRIILHMTDIRLAEIERQIRDYVAEAAQAVRLAPRRALKGLSRKASRDRPLASGSKCLVFAVARANFRPAISLRFSHFARSRSANVSPILKGRH
jgi:hypothetical protein